ncbi:ubiquinone anaerobic biosynthesis accessory factor UbiT [Solemya velesiana gill symbiont]|uniref:Ubiquinone biosynthesis accessory factor UbiT n=1 Tax=Solemya velesiana gill symbiont TaxID=1918948 RepID=A0A1T2KTL3_9GAMM|nr:SCP2 sterol-binding domain-containing protein [Solemya velesiana gill symbiont]OOZ36193.1 sterol-binding protein [Solemya velesiana gill symbiont]
MNSAVSSLPRLPKFPKPLALPLGLIPTAANSAILANILNRLFAPELADGELDFLEERVMLIEARDARLSYKLTLKNGRISAADSKQTHDLSIDGTVYDFLLLATRREDADTLFFNRRLRLGGDTELGLYVKNFLDALELDDRLGPLLKLLNGATTVIGKLP